MYHSFEEYANIYKFAADQWILNQLIPKFKTLTNLADYLTTNTFRTTPRSYKKLGLSKSESELLSKASLNNAVLAAKNASRDIFVFSKSLLEKFRKIVFEISRRVRVSCFFLRFLCAGNKKRPLKF